MDMVESIAAAGMNLSSARLMMDVNSALMDKTLDTAREQGQALQNMIESAAPPVKSSRLLDVYA